MIRVSHDNTPIKVVGIGGGAVNSIGMMIENPIKGVEYCIINNDYYEIQPDDRFQDKVTLMALSSQPHTYRKYTLPLDPIDSSFYKYYDNDENKANVYSIIDISTKHVIIVAGFGGIIGTDGTKWLADICKSLNIPVTVVCTVPFNFEGEKKLQRSLDAIKILKESGISIKVLYVEDIIEMHDDFNLFNSFSYLDNHVAEAVTEICNELEGKTGSYDPDRYEE